MNKKFVMPPGFYKDKFIELTHAMCVLVIKNQGQESPAEEKLQEKLLRTWDSLSIAEQDEIEAMGPYCDHPDGWIAEDVLIKGPRREIEDDLSTSCFAEENDE